MTRARCPVEIVVFAVAGVLVALAAGCGREVVESPLPQSLARGPESKPQPASGAIGSKRCQDCHAEFYKLWSTSWHGLAMRPYTAEFAADHLSPQQAALTIGKRTYRAEIGPAAGWIRESGPDGDRTYPIAHVMGGKNVYYLLTPMPRGRLQVLPLAYDVHKTSWYDMAASGVRHFPDRSDAALDWTDRLFAFNTTCFNCHVTELSTNYDLATDTYHTTWAEPGISCESCHGPAKEHVEAMTPGATGHASKDEPKGTVPFSLRRKLGQSPKDIKIIRAKDFTPAQMNDMCATCHAKLIPLSLSFQPGKRFFDHFDLVTLEHPDFYPDGRDLGENYTYTSWLMSPCAQSGKLDCNHCHTPSGRMRFEGENSNRACMPCHESEVKQPAAHGHHKPLSKGNECIACHMPMTRFAAMGRSDHSMRPPTPAATVAFGSPNACNLCHTDQNAAWSDQWVRKWYARDYQAEVLRRAELIDAARKRQWTRLPEVLAEVQKNDAGEVVKASLVRLLHSCDDPRKWPVLLGRLQDASPLVRSSAASALADHPTPEVRDALLASAADPSRLVRIRTAMSLAGLPPESLDDAKLRAGLEKANGEFIAAMQARPDDWASYANLGNFYMERRDFTAAASSFETAARLEPRQIGPLVNASMAYSNLRQNDTAEESLRRALKVEPGNAAANFNLGLLLGEQGRLPEAEQALRTALKSDPQMAQAAYNLGVLLGEKNLDEAIAWCKKAYDLRPTDPKYAQTLVFFLRKKGNVEEAMPLLRRHIEREPGHVEPYLLLGQIYEERHDLAAAAAVYRAALKLDQLPAALQRELQAKIRAIESRNPGK